MTPRKSRSPRLECHPLTPDRWMDFETLFGERGACGGCWCMLWRLSRSTFERQKGTKNKQAMLGLIQAGETPGLLGYVAGEPVAWCAIAPRVQYPGLSRSRVLKPVDDQPVWSVSCFFVRKDQRNRGLTVQLLKAAVDFVRRQGGQIVEGYPVEPKSDEMPPVFAWTGIRSAFVAAGFQECARHSPGRPIMRCVIKPGRIKTRTRRRRA